MAGLVSRSLSSSTQEEGKVHLCEVGQPDQPAYRGTTCLKRKQQNFMSLVRHLGFYAEVTLLEHIPLLFGIQMQCGHCFVCDSLLVLCCRFKPLPLLHHC